jgi:hypothetical protein
MNGKRCIIKKQTKAKANQMAHAFSLEIDYLPKLINLRNPKGHARTVKTLKAMLLQQSEVNKGK